MFFFQQSVLRRIDVRGSFRDGVAKTVHIDAVDVEAVGSGRRERTHGGARSTSDGGQYGLVNGSGLHERMYSSRTPAGNR